MVTSRRRLAPLVLLGLLVQVGAPAFAGSVLCVGSDGHVAVEAGGCADESAGAASRCDELGYPLPCNDTPLGAAELAAPSPRAADPGAALAPAPGLAPAPPLAIWSARALAAALIDPSRAHRSLTLRL